MVNPEESQIKDEKDVYAGNTENDLGEEDKDDRDPVGEDDVEDSSRMSERLYQSDSIHLRSILPNELWLMILDMLNDSPEDWRNCVNASPYFWEMQRHQRMFLLFPDVFDILVKLYEPRVWLKVDEAEVGQPVAEVANPQGQEDMDLEIGAENVAEAADPENWDVDDDDDADHEPEYRPGGRRDHAKKWKNAVLKCRLVCKSWNETIENCYSRPDMSGIRDFKNDSDPRSPVNLMAFPWFVWKLRIGSTRKAEQFVEHFGQSHNSGERAPPKNPVLGRYLWIDFEDLFDRVEHFLESLNSVTKLLNMFGKWLWYTHINVPSWRLTDDQSYVKIREWLCLMPNLKYLQFEEICCFRTVSQAVITANPMPKLENIQLIDLNYRCRGTVINEVIRANAHVPQLKFWESHIDEEIGTVLSNISAFSSNELSSFDFKMLEKYGSSWKLNKASVENYYGDFKGIFQVLEKNWGNTLTDLGLRFSSGQDTNILDGSKNTRLNLPHIRRLRLHIDDSLMLLEFILPLVNTLEYLEIKTYSPNSGFRDEDNKRDAEEKNQTIQFVGYEERMHQSNIWQIFKKLKTIKMEFIEKFGRFAVYTRAGEKIAYVHDELLSD